MAMKRYEKTETLEQGRVVSASGLRAVADNWGEVGKTASAVGNLAFHHGVEQRKIEGEQEGEQAVWVDPETNKVSIVGTLPEGTRPYAVAYRKSAEARYQAEVGLSSVTKAAELANANAGNPEGFRNEWAGYMKGVTESVPISIRPGVDLLLKEQGVRQYYKMQQEDFERTRQEAGVTSMNLIDSLERSAVDTLRDSGLAGGSPQFLDDQLTTARTVLDSQVKAGVIAPQTANERIKDYEFRLVRGMVSGEAIKMAKEGKVADVDKFLDEFKRTGSDRVDDYQRDQIANFARGEVATEMARAKATASAANDAAKKQVKDVIEVSWKGEQHAMDDATALRMATATGDIGLVTDLQASLAARTTIKEFSLLTPQEQEAALAQAENETELTGDSLKLRGSLEGVYKETTSALDSGETLQLANARGLVTTDPLDLANPATLTKRAADVAKVDQQMATESHPLLPAEKENVIRLFDGLDSDGKIALYNDMKKGMGHDLTLRAMRQLGQERPAMAMAMAISDDAPEVARSILMGDLALQADKTVLPDGKGFDVTFRDYIGTAIQGDDTLRNAIYQSALAVHADRLKRGKDDDFEKAIDTVTGGITEYNGFKTIVPKRGMAAGDFDDLLDKMTDANFQQAAGGKKLVALKVSEGVTTAGQEVSADLIHSRGIFEWIGDGQYILKINISPSLSGQTVFLADDKGLIKDQWGRPIPAELDLKPFVGGQ